MVGFDNNHYCFDSVFRVEKQFTPDICEEEEEVKDENVSFKKMKKNVDLLDGIDSKKRIPGIRLLKKINKMNKTKEPKENDSKKINDETPKKLKIKDIDRISKRMSKIINEF
jgi:hypothetical protein